MASSLSTSSLCARIDTHSPAAIEMAPAKSPLIPASRTSDPSADAPRDADDESDVGHQTVAEAENGSPGFTSLHIPVAMHQIAVRVLVIMLVIMLVIFVCTVFLVISGHRQQSVRPDHRSCRSFGDYSTGMVPIRPDCSKDAISAALRPSSVRIS